ncbi:MAG: IS1595 family transposase, partial [Proteobacteria bacterium]|nr:IS1595 family transposase [Pseudomonadota bacterium]
MNLIEVVERFPDQESCIDHLERVRWQGKPICPHCSSKSIKPKKEDGEGRIGRWHCHDCNASFKVTCGTVFHGTKIPLQKWFLAIALVTNAKKSLSSCQLSRDLDLNQKTAWYILTRIRAEMAHKTNSIILQGIIEADETFIGGKPRKENKKKDREPAPRGRGTSKLPVIGAVERGGNVVAKVIDNISGRTILDFIKSV